MKNAAIRETAPFRFDCVGSFLRTKVLKQARADFLDRKISEEKLKEIEDQEIIKLIAKQESLGLRSITDGEYRRTSWDLDFFLGLQGVKSIKYKRSDSENYFQGLLLDKEVKTAVLNGKISGENHPFIEHFKFLNDHISANSVAKITIPGSAQFFHRLTHKDRIDLTKRVYSTKEELKKDIVKVYKTVINDLYNAGARVIQFDDCCWLLTVNPLSKELTDIEKSKELRRRHEFLEDLLDVSNHTLEGLPSDLVITTHACRGNYRSRWNSTGGYEAVAETMFAKEKVNAFFLEYDSDRAGDFTPLVKIPKYKLIVLGLVTTKAGQLESKNEVINRIEEASRYVDIDRICLSPQCGFASTEEGNELTEDEQWAKIRLIKEIAEEVWPS